MAKRLPLCARCGGTLARQARVTMTWGWICITAAVASAVSQIIAAVAQRGGW